jgi:hypothetical protein
MTDVLFSTQLTPGPTLTGPNLTYVNLRGRIQELDRVNLGTGSWET